MAHFTEMPAGWEYYRRSKISLGDISDEDYVIEVARRIFAKAKQITDEAFTVETSNPCDSGAVNDYIVENEHGILCAAVQADFEASYEIAPQPRKFDEISVEENVNIVVV